MHKVNYGAVCALHIVRVIEQHSLFLTNRLPLRLCDSELCVMVAMLFGNPEYW